LARIGLTQFVMPGLVPGIHALATRKSVDGQDKPGHDGQGAAVP
jgi:hypothetical protein